MIVKKDSTGHPTYITKKGEFRWEKNIDPEYRWFNGQMNYTTFLTTFDDRSIVQINHPDRKSRRHTLKNLALQGTSRETALRYSAQTLCQAKTSRTQRVWRILV